MKFTINSFLTTVGISSWVTTRQYEIIISQVQSNLKCLIVCELFPFCCISLVQYWGIVVQGRGAHYFKVGVKDDFQSVLRSLTTLMFINIINGSHNGCESMLFVKNHNMYLIFETFQILFPTASLIFAAVKLFHEVIWKRTKYKALTASYP